MLAVRVASKLASGLSFRSISNPTTLVSISNPAAILSTSLVALAMWASSLPLWNRVNR